MMICLCTGLSTVVWMYIIYMYKGSRTVWDEILLQTDSIEYTQGTDSDHLFKYTSQQDLQRSDRAQYLDRKKKKTLVLHCLFGVFVCVFFFGGSSCCCCSFLFFFLKQTMFFFSFLKQTMLVLWVIFMFLAALIERRFNNFNGTRVTTARCLMCFF